MAPKKNFACSFNSLTFIIFFLLPNLSPALSSPCIQKKPLLKIGCTYDCPFTKSGHFNRIAKNLNYNLQITDLSKNPTIDPLTLDAILIPGGEDINPEFYIPFIPPALQKYTRDHIELAEVSEEGTLRDPLEFNLLRNYKNDPKFLNTPLLGICRGMQMMAVSSELPLYLDISVELGIPNRYGKYDTVFMTDPNSLMSQLYMNKKTTGYKYHHQGIRVAYFKQYEASFPDLKIGAYSNNQKIAESLEFLNRPALGIQFHPEKARDPENSDPIFNWFLNKACEKSNLR